MSQIKKHIEVLNKLKERLEISKIYFENIDEDLEANVSWNEIDELKKVAEEENYKLFAYIAHESLDDGFALITYSKYDKNLSWVEDALTNYDKYKNAYNLMQNQLETLCKPHFKNKFIESNKDELIECINRLMWILSYFQENTEKDETNETTI